jgi:lysophospholipase L1-like esterase
MAGFGRSKGEAGERWFQRVLLAGCLLVLAGLGLIALYLVLRPARPDDIYFELQRQASFVYLGFWAAIALVGGLLALMRRTQFLALYVLLLIAAEGAAHVYFYAHNGWFYHPISPVLLTRFEPHPLLVGVPHPGTYGPVTHDEDHHRRTWNEGKSPNPTLIAALGGSTTYDIGNADDATWPSDLSKLLGKDYAVENLGVPGYSSLENLIQSLFAFRDRRPACAIYYVGWNDLHTAHVKDLRSDYSDYQLPSQIGNLAVGRRSGFLENNMLLLRMILSVFATPERQAQGRMSGESDPRLSQIFSENMRLIADIDRHFGVKAIFVPQVLDYARFKEAGSSGWIPLVPDKDVKTVMQALNQDLAAVAKETGTLFLDKPLSVAWQNSDFVDQGHFSAAGAKKFAEAIAGDIAANCQPEPGAQ